MSCASCGYTHSPQKNANQALNHLHILLFFHSMFKGPAVTMTSAAHLYMSRRTCLLLRTMPVLSSHTVFSPRLLATDSPCLSPGSTQRLQMCLNPARTSVSQSGMCFSPFLCLLGCGEDLRDLRLVMSPRYLSRSHLEAVVLAKTLHSE